MANKPYYPHFPISSRSSLAIALGVNERVLTKTLETTEDSYTGFLIQTKSGKDREVFDPKQRLKYIQKRINKNILEKIDYPKYLMGGLKGSEGHSRDYISNSKIHSKAKTLISLDIKNFFPSIKREYVFDVWEKLLKFPPSVSEDLTKLSTLDGSVPQGGCTSSYIANLLFFNSEYDVVTKLKSRGIFYSRLLDDITLSSKEELSEKQINDSISIVDAMVKQYGLKLHKGKTKVEHKHNINSPYEVTGSCIRHGEPKLSKKKRNQIRAAVKECEIEYNNSPYSTDYHSLWNKTSGRVALLGRFNHKNEEKKYRALLNSIKPLYDDKYAKTLQVKVCQIVNRKKKNNKPIPDEARKTILKIYHELGILSRNKKSQSSELKAILRCHFGELINNPYY